MVTTKKQTDKKFKQQLCRHSRGPRSVRTREKGEEVKLLFQPLKLIALINTSWPILICLSLACGCTPPGPRALLEAKRLIEQGKYARAIEKMRSATSLLATNAQAWNYLGLACHYAGQGDDAERAYRRALVLNHDLTEAHYNLACLLLAQNKPEKTEAAKTELLTYTLRRGNSAEGLIKLGVAQLRSRELVGAERSFSDALKFGPKNPEALNGAGLVRVQRGRPDEAARYFQAALKEQPVYRPALLNLAIVAQQYLNDRQLALQKYREYAMLRPPPGASEAEVIRGLSLQLERELKPPPHPAATNIPKLTNANLSLPKVEATNVQVTNFLRSANPPRPVVATNQPRIATILSNQANEIPKPDSVSKSSFEMVRLPDDPIFKPAQDISISEPAGQKQMATPEPNTAKPTPATVPPPSSTPRRSFFGRINPLNLFRSGEKQHSPPPSPPTPASEALPAESLTSSASVAENANSGGANIYEARYQYVSPSAPPAGNRTQAQTFFEEGVTAQRAKRTSEAIKAYRQATQADGSFFEAHYNLGLALTEAGDLSGALAAYESALAVRPDSLDARYNFALVLKRADYFIDAGNELEKLLAHFPDEPRANLALGNLYANQLQQTTKARQYYLKVLQTDPHNTEASAIRYWLTSNPQ